MKLRKTVTEEGEITIEAEIDGNWIKKPGFGVSRQLTGTTSEKNSGVFEVEEENFHFGNYNRTFVFESRLDYKQSVSEIAKVLQDRIDKVSAWVAECKSKACTEIAEVLPAEQVVERLKDQNRLLYRNKAGQIKPLDI